MMRITIVLIGER